MMKRTSITRTCVALVLLVLAVLWLKELTQRRAIEASGFYVYPFDTLATYSYSVFSLAGIRRANGELTGPGWLVGYGETTFIPTVAVSIFGKVQGSNYPPLDAVLNLTDSERQKTLIKWVADKRAEPTSPGDVAIRASPEK